MKVCFLYIFSHNQKTKIDVIFLFENNEVNFSKSLNEQVGVFLNVKQQKRSQLKKWIFKQKLLCMM